MRCIIAGSRDATKWQVRFAIVACDWSLDITEVVSGGARGADRYGEEWARACDIPVRKFPALWGKYGKSAGQRRNTQMAQNADALIAIWDGVSPGTEDMIQQATSRHLLVSVYRTDKEKS